MKKILLVNSNTEGLPYPVSPLGLGMIATALKNEGYEVKVFDGFWQENNANNQNLTRSLTNTLKIFEPDFIGISLRNIDDIVNHNRLSKDNSFYIQNACASDSTLAPDGKSTIYILVPVPNNRSGIDWEKERNSFRDHILDQVEKKTELKDIRQHIEAEKVITPFEWEKEYNVYKAATFNLRHNIGQMLYLRPRNKYEECENLYLVGGGTHPGSGLPTIYESARISSNLLCEKHGVAYNSPSSLDTKRTFS